MDSATFIFIYLYLGFNQYTECILERVSHDVAHSSNGKTEPVRMMVNSYM
jgi:hypothetical protein